MKHGTKLAIGWTGVLCLAGGAVAGAVQPTSHQTAPVARVAPTSITPAQSPTPAPVAPTAAAQPVTPVTTPAAAPAPVPVTPTTDPVTTTTVAPQTAPVAPAPPVAADPAPTPTTAPAGAPDGPQPIGPSVTVEQTTCLATWYITTTDPTTGVTSQVEDFYGGDCTEANTLAAEYGGTVTQSTNPVTTTPGEIPGT